MTTFWLLPLLLFAAWFWLDGMRAREFAVTAARRACKRNDVQLLDETVALIRLRVGRGNNGLRWRRTYRFEFTEEGDRRQGGELELLGLRVMRMHLTLEQFTLHEMEPDDDETPVKH